ncbi:MAG: enoyl-CoA hydratase/isomerase family protein, partial [Planctomycetes bacterium]|nr:enoyl-CoA hydratase/isomerase family protein [Planctomycetota bacterium]
MTDQPILTSSTYDEGSVLHLAFSKPKGNVIDRDLVAALDAAIAAAANAVEVRVILIEGLGKNFSYGASVEEHLPDQVASMLAGFHGLFRTMIKTSTPLLAVVRGHCLGGGLELAAFCHRVFAAPEAKLGQPEINLGVFAPVASAVLPYRCGQVVADDLLLSGR